MVLVVGCILSHFHQFPSKEYEFSSVVHHLLNLLEQMISMYVCSGVQGLARVYLGFLSVVDSTIIGHLCEIFLLDSFWLCSLV